MKKLLLFSFILFGVLQGAFAQTAKQPKTSSPAASTATNKQRGIALKKAGKRNDRRFIVAPESAVSQKQRILAGKKD